MSQQIPFRTVLSSAASNAENFPTKVNQNAATKRSALTVLNGNQRQKEIWKCDAFSTTQPVPRAEPGGLKFTIFQDKEPQKENVPSESSLLPKCVTQLLTYDNKTKKSDGIAKENNFSWDRDVPRTLSSRQKEYLEWSSPYIADIYTHLREVELKFRPKPSYMTKQQDITLSMRSVLVDWLVEVGEEYKLHPETIHLAVSYTDRFLSQMSVLRGKLQLVGTACMFISSKYEEIYPPELREFVYITDDTYSKKQVLRMEHLVLRTLDFNVATPTAYTFLHLFCCLINASEKISYLAQYICELSLLEADPFLMFLPSHIAAGSLALAKYTLGEPMWGEEMASSTGFSLRDIGEVVACLYERHSQISTYPQLSIREKYRSSKFQCAAEIAHQKQLLIPE